MSEVLCTKFTTVSLFFLISSTICSRERTIICDSHASDLRNALISSRVVSI